MPPPPPPPPQSPNSQTGSVAQLKRMKPFFWNKVDHTTDFPTVWNEDPKTVELDMVDLEATFSLDRKPVMASKMSVESAKKKEIVTVLDITRANHVAIMLSRIKLTYPEIRNALLDLEDDKLTIDNLKALSRHIPTCDEIGRIKSFGDITKLAKADQYFSEITDIPRFSERLECMLYRRKLDLEVEEIRPELNILRNACRELRNSNKFKTILYFILALGNALNGSSYRGNARGFQLDTLTKLKDTKTVGGGPVCPTLLHYLARLFLYKNPLLISFIDELPNLEAAARVSVQTVLHSIEALMSGLSHIKQEVQELRRLNDPSKDSGRFIEVMEDFVRKVHPSLAALRSMGSSLDKDLRDLMKYYGENPGSSEALTAEDFFGLIVSFSSSLQKCAWEVHEAEEKIRKSIPTLKNGHIKGPGKESMITAEQAKQSTRSTTQDQHSVRRGDLDQTIRSMRAGRQKPRATRPLSKIFLDGGSTAGRSLSRLFQA